MNFTFDDVRYTIRDKYPEFDPLLSGDGALARHLTDYQVKLLSKATSVNKTYASLQETVTLPLADFEHGIAVPQALNYFGATLRLPGGAKRFPMRMTTQEDRFTPRRFPAGYVMEQTLYLMGKESKWPNGSTVLLRYTPIPADITQGSSEFVLQRDARGCCAAAGALFLAIRIPALIEEPQRLAPFSSALKDEEATFLQNLAQR